MQSIPMYEIWCARSGKANKGPRFKRLADALRFVHTQADGSTYAIRTPEGQWHHFARTGGVTLRKSRTSGVFDRVEHEKVVQKGAA